MRLSAFLIAAAMSAHPALAEDGRDKHAHASPYAGEQARDIKALSQQDVEEILRGGGWGLAKAAELNGMPGPTHVLDMAADLNLSPGQTVEWLYLSTLSRRPTAGEQAAARRYLERPGSSYLGVLWMLVNRSEYLLVR